MTLFVAGSTDSITGPLPPHFPLKTPGIATEEAKGVGKSNLVNISFIAEVVAGKLTGLTLILDFNFEMSMLGCK